MNNKFKLKDENGVEREATIVTSIELNEKNYLIYSIDRDSESINLFVSQLTKDGSGNNIIVDIENKEEKLKLDEMVKQIIKLPLD